MLRVVEEMSDASKACRVVRLSRDTSKRHYNAVEQGGPWHNPILGHR